MPIPIQTDITLLNQLNKDYVTLDSVNYWHGFGQPPPWIQADSKAKFTHNADDAGSVGGAAYLLREKIKWVISWSNTEEEPNKVYTKILKYNEAINWDDIKAHLQKSGNQSTDKTEGYVSELVIDPSSPTPEMTVKLRLAQ